MTTNISPEHRNAYDALVSGRYDNFALFSCFVNGEPAAAIVAITRDGNDFNIQPLFVSVTAGMALADHQGGAPAAGATPYRGDAG